MKRGYIYIIYIYYSGDQCLCTLYKITFRFRSLLCCDVFQVLINSVCLFMLDSNWVRTFWVWLSVVYNIYKTRINYLYSPVPVTLSHLCSVSCFLYYYIINYMMSFAVFCHFSFNSPATSLHLAPSLFAVHPYLPLVFWFFLFIHL